MTFKRHYRATMLILITLTGCSSHPEGVAQGYIEGRYTYMATSVSGVLKELLVQRGTEVKQGQELFALEAQPESDVYQAASENLQQMIAARDAIAANLAYAKLTFERNQILVPKHAIQQSELDRSRSVYDANIAQLAQAEATINASTASLAEAKWRQGQKVVYAPVDGTVFDTYYRLGEYTTENQPVLSLLAPEDIKAIFFIGEKDLSRLHLGDAVTVNCDKCQKAYTAKISFISPSAEYTPPVIYSTETNEKLIYRIEARFDKEDAYQLHPGQPVNVAYRMHE